MTYVIETLETLENDIVRAEVFTVDGGAPRVLDHGEVLPTFKAFKTVDAAIAYVKKCVEN